MKKFVLWMLAGFFISLPAFADQVDEQLQGADDTLKAQTRAMIQSGINAEDAIGMTRAMIQQRFTQQQMLQARQMVMTAAQKGLPVEPIMSKAQEGAAKQVPSERIVGAMQQVSQRYTAAYAYAERLALQGPSRQGAGDRLAEAMAAGLNQAACDRIMDQLQDRTRDIDRLHAASLALETLTTTRELARAGVPAPQNAAMICLALQNNYQAQQMQQLRNQFRSQSRFEDPQGLAQRYTYAFQHGQDPASGSQGGQGSQSGGQGQGVESRASNAGGNQGGSDAGSGGGGNSGSGGGGGNGGGSGGSGR